MYKKLIIAGVVLWLIYHPMTRPIILWLLPLGSGVDDLIAVGVCVVLFIYFWKDLPNLFKRGKKDA